MNTISQHTTARQAEYSAKVVSMVEDCIQRNLKAVPNLRSDNDEKYHKLLRDMRLMKDRIKRRNENTENLNMSELEGFEETLVNCIKENDLRKDDEVKS